MTSELSQSTAIEVSGIWKIFGDQATEALAAIREQGLSKSEVLESFNCGIGVADVSFSVKRGEIFCIMGLSGSGKSTLVRHINRLLEPTDGHVYVDGDDVMRMDDAQLRKLRNERISMVFQQFGLLPHRSVLDNVALPLEFRRMSKSKRWEAAEQALALVELGDWKNRFAHELSGGMQQRVGLARALAADPEILLMDEPFSALDPLIRRQLQDEFMRLSARMNKTTIFITHDLDEAIRIGHRIAIMRDGRLIQVGTPEDIILNPIDDYVSDFVAGISRLKLVYAHSVMQPLQSYISTHGSLPAQAPRVLEQAAINELIDLAVASEDPLVVTDAAGLELGVVTRVDLLKGLQGGRNND